jgi:hypothetical protein
MGPSKGGYPGAVLGCFNRAGPGSCQDICVYSLETEIVSVPCGTPAVQLVGGSKVCQCSGRPGQLWDPSCDTIQGFKFKTRTRLKVRANRLQRNLEIFDKFAQLGQAGLKGVF